MGILRSAARRVHLLPFHRVGRAPGLDLVLDDDGVSREQATLAWTASGWALRDLGSRNGTWLGGTRVPSGEDQPLQQGDRLGFGGAEGRWILESADAPVAFARAASGGEVAAEEDLLLLPSAEDPRAVVRRDAEGRWIFDDGGEVRPVADGAQVSVGDETLLLRLPTALPTTSGGLAADQLADATLQLAVDEDEARVQAWLFSSGRGQDLGVRAHHRLLLTLARERTRALRRGEPEPEVGWVRLEDVATHLGLTLNAFHVQLHRLRAQLAGLEPAASQLIERRFNGDIRLAAVKLRL